MEMGTNCGMSDWAGGTAKVGRAAGGRRAAGGAAITIIIIYLAHM